MRWDRIRYESFVVMDVERDVREEVRPTTVIECGECWALVAEGSEPMHDEWHRRQRGEEVW